MHPTFEEASKKTMESLKKTLEAYDALLVSNNLKDWQNVIHFIQKVKESRSVTRSGLIINQGPPADSLWGELLKADTDLNDFESFKCFSLLKKQGIREILSKALDALMKDKQVSV